MHLFIRSLSSQISDQIISFVVFDRCLQLQRVESPGNAMANFNPLSSTQNAVLNEKAGGTVDVKGTFGEQKSGVVFIERVPTDSSSSLFNDPEPPKAKHEAVETDLQLVTRVLSVEDDPSENPWTFRMWFLGMICYYVFLP
jgi:hypothetical protein